MRDRLSLFALSSMLVVAACSSTSRVYSARIVQETAPPLETAGYAVWTERNLDLSRIGSGEWIKPRGERNFGLIEPGEYIIAVTSRTFALQEFPTVADSDPYADQIAQLLADPAHFPEKLIVVRSITPESTIVAVEQPILIRVNLEAGKYYGYRRGHTAGQTLGSPHYDYTKSYIDILELDASRFEVLDGGATIRDRNYLCDYQESPVDCRHSSVIASGKPACENKNCVTEKSLETQLGATDIGSRQESNSNARLLSDGTGSSSSSNATSRNYILKQRVCVGQHCSHKQR